MFFSLRQIAVVVSAFALIFFCSCERHHPDETLGLEPAKPEPAKREHAKTQPHPSASSASSPTPAEFFPSSTPH